jgi:methionine sulfoxide reductase heme-binding subunit
MSSRKILLLKIAVWIGGFVPLGRLLYKGWTVGLGANPIEFITLSTGTWTLIFLLTTLSITPLRKLTGQSWLIRIRRLIGLFAFFYASLHFTTYVWLDKFFDFQEMVQDVMKRRFITAGFLAFTLLVPLAMTSTTWAVRKLGGKNWQRLHRLIYLSAIAAVIHFWWKVKADVREPAIYAAILGGLLLLRLAITASEKYRKPSRRLKSGPVQHPGTQPAAGPD